MRQIEAFRDGLMLGALLGLIVGLVVGFFAA